MPELTAIRLEAVRESLRHATGPYVLDATDDTVTVAVPISRETIRDHHAFLHAVSEFAAEWGPSTTGAVELDTKPLLTKLRRIWRNIATQSVCTAALCFLGLTVAGSAYTATELMRPSVYERQSAIVRNPVVHYGENLVVDITGRKNRDCPTSGEDMILRPDGSIAWERRTYQRRAAHMPLGEWTTFPVSVPIGPHIPLGNYTFMVTLTPICNWFFNPRTYHFPTTEDQTVAFTVE